MYIPFLQVYTELDTLRTAKSSLESEVGNLKAQLNQAKDAVQKEAEKVKATANDLNKVVSEKAGLESKVKTLEAGLSSEGGLKEELAEVRVRLSSVEKENSRLGEENERLAEQLAANVERPRAEGQEANGKTNGVENGHNGVSAEEEKKQGQVWQKKYQLAVQEKESA